MDSPNATEPVQVPVSSDWEQMFYNTVGFMPPRAEAQPAAPPAAPQPPAEGQGQPGEGTPAGSKGSEGGVNWGLFPDVPEDQRAIAEPIVRQMQGHVTQMEQQLSPLKPLFDQGLQADDVAALGGFAVGFNQNPVDAVVQLMQQMQQHQMIPQDTDVDSIARALNGQWDDNSDQGGAEVPAGGNNDQGNPEIAELRAEIKRLTDADQQRQQNEASQRDQQALNEALGKMRTALSEAKVPEPDETLLVSALVAHKGNVDEAIKSLVDYRNAGIKGVAKTDEPGGSELDMPSGPPSTRKSGGGRGGRGKDSWGQARQGATQHLRSVRRAEAQ